MLRLDLSSSVRGLGPKTKEEVLTRLERAGFRHPARNQQSAEKIAILERSLEKMRGPVDTAERMGRPRSHREHTSAASLSATSMGSIRPSRLHRACAPLGDFDPKKELQLERKNPKLTAEEFHYLKSHLTLTREHDCLSSGRNVA